MDNNVVGDKFVHEDTDEVMKKLMKKNLMVIMMRILILNLKRMKNLILTQIPVQNLKLEK